MRLPRALTLMLICCLLGASALADDFFIFTDHSTAPDDTGSVFSTASDTATPDAAASPAPSSAAPAPDFDGTYWTLPPGDTDDARVWKALMQPITVYELDDPRSHVYLMENPDGSGKKIAQIHGRSQGLRIIGEKNEHGYVLAQAYSNYDKDFTPGPNDDLAEAYSLKEGYIKASGLKTINVMTDYALVVDKLKQCMYIYVKGERVAELSVSTGLNTDQKLYLETPAGEFITQSHVGPFSTHKYMQSEMAIRISGGILIHEVPYEPRGDGSRKYDDFEAKLGSKASAGCIRVQRKEDENGYSQQWIWDHFKAGSPYKVIIWDDKNR